MADPDSCRKRFAIRRKGAPASAFYSRITALLSTALHELVTIFTPCYMRTICHACLYMLSCAMECWIINNNKINGIWITKHN